jgi:hypothetical protein
MTQVVGEHSVLGDFNEAAASFDNHDYRFFRRGGNFMAEVRPSIDGTKESEEYSCVLSTGSHHMQVYWVETAKGRAVAKLPLAYLLSEARWVPFDSTFLRPPGAHTGLEAGEWNMVCIHCHTTSGQPRLKFTKEGSLRRGDLYDIDSRVAEFGISCEACHGPSLEHVREAKNPWTRYQLHFGRAVDEGTVQPQKLPPRLSSQVCGTCHSVAVARSADDMRSLFAVGCNYRAGDDLFDAQASDRIIVQTGLAHPGIQDALAREPNYITSRFWSDGMIRVSGREYNGLIESPCYEHADEAQGVLSCLSCHQMHQLPHDPRPIREWADDQLKVGMDGDLACTQCHREYADGSVLADHTRHEIQSEGSRCYNCHMPHTSYGLLKAIRSHTVSSPSVQESLTTGRPNACNLCHLDKSLDWAAEHLGDRYGIPRPELLEDEKRLAASVLWALRGDAGQRALVAWSMGWHAAREASGEDWLPPHLAHLMTDPYDAVRYIAYHSLIRIRGFEQLQYDFMAEADRRKIIERVRRMRQAASASVLDPRGEVLLDSQGELDQSALTRLLRDRDTRPVLLNE